MCVNMKVFISALQDASSMLSARGGHAAEALDANQLVVIGGWDEFQESLQTVEIFDDRMTSKKWAPGPSLPVGRDSAASGIINGEILVAYGRCTVRFKTPPPPFPQNQGSSRHRKILLPVETC
jgi:hypothetical protein